MKYLTPINLNLSNFAFKARVHFQQNCANVLRLPTDALYLIGLERSLNIEDGFELYLEDCVKVILEKAELTLKPNIIDNNTILKNTAVQSLQKYLDKTFSIGTFKTKKIPNNNANIYIEYPPQIINSTIETLFLEGITKYIVGMELPSHITINGNTSFYSDYINTYGIPFTKNIDNILGYNNPSLVKEIIINISGAKLKTYEESPVLINNGLVENPNPFQQDISNASNKIQLKI